MTATSRRAANHARDSRGDEWLTVDEACRIVKIARRTLERYIARGIGPRVSRPAGSRRGPVRIRREWLDEWMEEAA